MNSVAVILAGGSGSRLWPLATSDHPKLLLETLGRKTMFDATLFRAKLFADDVFMIVNNSTEYAASHLAQQFGVPDENVIVEPHGADTAAAIAYVTAHVKKIHGFDTTITLLPVDHQIRNHGAFYQDITFAIESAITQNRLTLFGVTPSFPSTGYGYIRLGKEINHRGRSLLFAVDRFLEKPNETAAAQMLKDANYVWNSGIYTGTIEAFEHAFQRNPSLYDWYSKVAHANEPALPEAFKHFQFEHELIENTVANLQVVTATFDWKDIGTYDELYRSALETDANGNAIKANATLQDCTDCLVIGNGRKIVALGLDDIAIVDGPDGILVCQKSKYSQFVGEVATGKEQPGHHHE